MPLSIVFPLCLQTMDASREDGVPKGFHAMDVGPQTAAALRVSTVGSEHTWQAVKENRVLLLQVKPPRALKNHSLPQEVAYSRTIRLFLW